MGVLLENVAVVATRCRWPRTWPRRSAD